MMQVTRPEDAMMEMVNSLVVSGDISTAALIHDDQFGEEYYKQSPAF